MDIFCSTSDKYHHALKVFCYLYEKYWNDPITILGYKEPNFELPKNFTFHSMGKDQGVQSWSTDLRRYFTNQKIKKYIWMMEDTFIYKPVDRNVLQVLWDNVDDTIVRADCGPVLYSFKQAKIAPYSIKNNIELFQATYRHKTNMPVSIWSRKSFLDFSKDSETPWQFERNGDAKSRDDKRVSLCTNPTKNLAVAYTEGVLHANRDILQLTNVDPDVIKELQSKGYVGEYIGKVSKWDHDGYKILDV